MQPTNYNSAGWAHIYHTNSMLNRSSSYYYQYAKGYKTGTLDESGRNLATLGSRDGNNYLLVTLGSPQYNEEGEAVYLHYEDHRMLYDWAFDNFEFTQLVQAGKEVSELQVRFGENSDFVRLVTADSYSCMWLSTVDTARLKESISVDESLLNEDGTITAPVTRGTVLGKYTLSMAGEEICTVDLAAQEDISMSYLAYSIDKAKQFVSSKYFIAAAAAAAVLIVIYTAVVASVKAKRKRRAKNVRRKRKL